jgi:hypothetical protein
MVKVRLVCTVSVSTPIFTPRSSNLGSHCAL